MATRRALYWLFTASGFAGLIYESVWSHYLKLVLGHAAYAQTLVLTLFMGGMALGAQLASRAALLSRRPLLAYAAVEAAIAVFALEFHALFELTTGWLLRSVIPAQSTALGVTLWKWGVCGGLILPEAVLLGMTFPLMSVGVMRLPGSQAGKTLATLYFSNSFGAVVGVLCSAFVLIPQLGLPGTVRVAGVVNVTLAAVVWLLARGRNEAPPPAERAVASAGSSRLDIGHLFVAAALLTGLASFFYEIAWVRMLSMVLGSSTQAFELMLAAFISGLALGSLLIRRRIESIEHPVRVSGYVQLAMGLLALLTLVEYNHTFDVVAYLVGSLAKTDTGYALWNLASHGLSLAVMLPTTLVAGTTLPLFTHVLLRSGHGEASVGRVYAANTLGAIAGVLLAVHMVMPLWGLKWVVGVGALVDAGLGALLLWSCMPAAGGRRIVLLVAAVAAAFVLVLGTTQLDPRRMASGVYRTGKAEVSVGAQVVFHRDGKTATIDVLRSSKKIMIATNGKADAAAAWPGRHPSMDESTMVGLGAFALAYAPEARSAANIGFGSGITTHTLLGSQTLRAVDTIELEPAVLEGARWFGRLSARAYSDPRSHFHVDDAKSFLSSRRALYDIVISEPSNPWVSGVASLFSRELYRDVKRHIRPGGLLVQWLQLYETDLDNIASVFKALQEHFDDYVAYNTNDEDMLVIATNGRRLGRPSAAVFAQPQLAADLSRVGIRDLGDIEARRIGDRRLLEGLFRASAAPANSDFYPYLAYRAPYTRFLSRSAGFAELHLAAVPVLELLDGQPRAQAQPWTETPHFVATGLQRIARWVHDVVTREGSDDAALRVPAPLRQAVSVVTASAGCAPPLPAEPELHASYHQLARLTSLLSAQQAEELWQKLGQTGCLGQRSPGLRAWAELYAADAARDPRRMRRAAEQALRLTGPGIPREHLELALTAGTLGALLSDGPTAALNFFAAARRDYLVDEHTPLELRLVVSTAAYRAGHL